MLLLQHCYYELSNINIILYSSNFFAVLKAHLITVRYFTIQKIHPDEICIRKTAYYAGTLF